MADPYELMEEIDLGVDEPEEVKRKLARFDFPVVTLTKDSKYFYANLLAKKLFDSFKRVRFFTTPQYVIFSDAKGDTKNSFAIKECMNKGNATPYYMITCPTNLKEKKLRPGYYKLYKCKQGFAFKRYEALGVQYDPS